MLLGFVLVAGCGGTPVAAGSPAAATSDDACCEIVVAPVKSARIRGEIESSTAEPAAPRRATLRGSVSVPLLASEIDERGRFFFGPLPPGSYELAIEDGRGEPLWSEPVEVADGDALELRIELAERATR